MTEDITLNIQTNLQCKSVLFTFVKFLGTMNLHFWKLKLVVTSEFTLLNRECRLKNISKKILGKTQIFK